MRQTAVEWLIDKICIDVEMHDEYGNVNGIEIWNALRSCTDLSEYINKAKEKEYRQITNAYESGIFDGFNRKSKDYYNETFKQQEKDIEF